MSIQVMVLTLDDYFITRTEQLELEEFNPDCILSTYFDSDPEAKQYYDVRTPNPSTISYMGEEGGHLFIKMVG